MKTKCLGLVLLCASALFGAFSAIGGIVPEKTYSNVLSLDVSASANLSDLLQSKGVTDISVYDCLEKSGNGILTNDVGISSFTGDILVKAGAIVVMVDHALGAASVEDSGCWSGFVAVDEGASLIWGGSTVFSASDKTVYFGGEGFDDRGALQSLSTGNQSKGGVWGKRLILTADATMWAIRNYQYMTKNMTIEMNGFTLGVANNNASYSIPFRPCIVGPGTVELTKGILAVNSDLQMQGGPENRFILDGGTVQYGSGTLDGQTWTMVVRSNAKVQCRGIAADGAAVWPFPIVLEDTLELTSSDTDYGEITFAGVVSGVGGIRVTGKDESDPATEGKGRSIGLHLTNAGNSFAGGVSVSHGRLFVEADTAVPQGGKVTFDGRCVIGGRSAINFGTFEVEDGASVAFEKVQDWHAPGLWYGYAPVRWATGKTLGNGYDPTDVFSNQVVMALEKTQSGAAAMPEDAADGSLYTYSGFVMNTDSVARVWSFAANIKYRSRLFVNGELTLGQTESSPVTGQATLQPGANAFLFQATTQNTGAGPNAGSSGPFKTLGFCLDRQGRDPASEEMQKAANWEVPVESGDGTLFRVASGRVQMIGAGFEFPYLVNISNAVFGVGSTLDIGGRDMTIGDLSGVPSIANAEGSDAGNSFRITGKWTFPTDGIGVADKMTYDRSASFADGASFAFADARTAYRVRGLNTEIVRAVGGVEGLPTAVADEKGVLRWKLSVAADGKAIEAEYIRPGLILVVE